MPNHINFLSRTIDASLAFFTRNKTRLLFLFLCALALAGTALFIWGTAPHGIGVTSDSVDYIWSARNLAAGKGLGQTDGDGRFKPQTVEPPLYPMLLAIFEWFHIDALVAARWLGALSLALMFVLFGLLIKRLTGGSFWFPVIGVLVLFCLPTTWTVSLYAMTEPPYLVLTFAGLLCLDRYLSLDRRAWLVSAAVLFGLAFLIRYVGGTIIAAGVIVLLFQKRLNRRRHFGDVFLFGGIAVAPMLVWLARNLAQAATATSYVVRFVPITAQEWQAFFATIQLWLAVLPNGKLFFIPLAAALIALPLAFGFLKRPSAPDPDRTQLPLLLAIYAGFYLLFIIASRWIAFPLVTFYQERLVYPFMVCLFCLLLYGLRLLLTKVERRLPRYASALLVSVFILLAFGSIASNKAQVRPYVQPLLISRYNGLGLQNQASFDPNLIARVHQLPVDARLFTDDVQRLYFYTGKPGFFINLTTSEGIARLNNDMIDQNVAVILFNTAANGPALEEQFPTLLPVSGTTNGTIYLVSK